MTWFERAVRMDEGNSHVELAVLLKRRKGGAARAMDLLKTAIALPPEQIEEDQRRRARLHLRRITGAA